MKLLAICVLGFLLLTEVLGNGRDVAKKSKREAVANDGQEQDVISPKLVHPKMSKLVMGNLHPKKRSVADVASLLAKQGKSHVEALEGKHPKRK